MRKIILLITISLFIFSCSSYRSLDLTKLTTGMTKAEVISSVGRPNRVLAVNDTKDGFQEVLEYRTGRDEIYALEFWNDFLTGYEFLYDDVNYRPALAPPYWYPDYYGRPIVIYSRIIIRTDLLVLLNRMSRVHPVVPKQADRADRLHKFARNSPHVQQQLHVQGQQQARLPAVPIRKADQVPETINILYIILYFSKR